MTSSPPTRRKRVVVIGAGFAGINLVRKLRKAPVDVILIDRHNYHLFQPLLYQVATAALSPADIAYPIRRIFRSQANVRVVLGEVDRIDLANKQICGGDVCLNFDYLAVCVGATHSYFGKDDQWRTIAPGLKDLDDATEIRRRVLLAFEEAELEQDEPSRRAKLTFVVIGGGPTGVEMAGALREIAAIDVPRDFRNIDTKTSRIILMEGGPRLLPQFDPSLSERAKRDLEAMGVDVRVNSHVTDVDSTGVTVGGGEHLAAQNIMWAAGVAAPKILATMDVPLDRSGRVIVNSDLSVPGHPHVFVLGDAASSMGANGKPVPGLAPAAMQMGKYVGGLIRDDVAGNVPANARPPFAYLDKGILATIGTHRAVADIRGWRFGGIFAWLAWSLIHIAFLVGFRNRVFVMAGWIYSYLAHGREARLITGTVKMLFAIRGAILTFNPKPCHHHHDGFSKFPLRTNAGCRSIIDQTVIEETIMRFCTRACAVLGMTVMLFSVGCRPSDQQVIGQANQVHSSLDPAVIKDSQVQDYVDKIGKRIVDAAIAYDKEGKGSTEHAGQDNTWMYSGNVQFHLVNSKTLNAFTTGGQHIYIYNQLFQDAKSEDELAGVMAHEFAHIYARHVHSGTERQYWPIATAALGAVAGYAVGGEDKTAIATAGAGAGAAAGTLFTNSFTRTDENEADKLGLAFYSRAGWDPNKFADFFKQMIEKGYDKTPEITSDHPSLANRVKATQERVASQSPEAAKARRRPNIATAQQFNAIQQRATTVAANTPNDQSLAAAQLMFSAFPSCVTPEDQPDQKSAQNRLMKAMSPSK